MKKIKLPLEKSVIRNLKAGQALLLSGTIYTARDAAHKALAELLKKKKRLPIPLRNEIIYYTGPTPAPPGKPIGSCGPTTSSRMDCFTVPLLKKGLKGMIGKGNRSKEVQHAIKKFKAVYFTATGGAGALLSRKIKKMKLVSFAELGPEAIYELSVENFPVIVAIDSRGRNIYEAGRKRK